ncbi:uncharacterized protein LOC119684697 [Teleopsis dalmanni]|uniref:uncharacterized protein LOC119684697 n=1 Tax=Teleopsis dalmanni TaxID=139649 RepID=UPI000D329A74|nr:uncharacterized protein LOC119684697 [Teleopsis dalmanni]
MNRCFINDTPLRTLLTSWNCEKLVEHIENESIDIAELEMMRKEHVVELLRNYRMGIRIRFEYYFENWRRSINKPVANISTVYMNTPPSESIYNEIQFGYEHNSKLKESVSIGVNTDPVETNIISLNLPPPPLLALPPSIKIVPIINKSLEVQKPKEVPQKSKVDIMDFCPPSNTRRTNKVVSIPKFSVLDILKSAGFRGFEILESYNQNKIMTPEHRSTLMTLMVEHFIKTNEHLSLPANYEIERQILELFPTEKLRYYRTARRGKIYIRYYNSKCCKKQRNMENKNTQSFVPSTVNESDIMENVSLLSDDATQESDVYSEPTEFEEFNIKTENDENDMEYIISDEE